MDKKQKMMRGAALLVASCIVSLLAGTAPALADNGPHVKGAGLVADTCAACHRAHTAQAPMLLKASQEDLCLTCHGSAAGGANNDVEDGVGYSGFSRTPPAKALRGGGFKYALLDSGHPSGNGYLGDIPVLGSGQASTSSHSINESSQMAWGNGEINASVSYGKEIKLACGTCHDPHGNGNYRVLRDIPKESGASSGVKIADASKYVYTTENYWEVEDLNASSFIANISSWCATCHTRYLAAGHSGREDSGDAVYAYRHRSDFTSQGLPSCAQCHVAHGSNASMGTYSSGVPNPKGEAVGSDSRLLRIDNRGVCQMCHQK